jgi:hypothetical protein
VIVNLTREDIAAMENELHLGEALGILAELEAIEAGPVWRSAAVTLRVY